MIRTFALLACLVAGTVHAESYPQAQSVVSIGGPVTEIVYALGQGHRLVAKDTTSIYPPEAHGLPDVGYMRRLSPEGVLSVSPDLIIARDTSGPVETMDLLRAASVPMVLVHDGFDAAAVPASIRTVGQALGVPQQADRLATQAEQSLAALARDVAAIDRRKRAVFILSATDGRLNVAGQQTGGHGLLDLAGATNIMGEAFVGYKQVSDEAMIDAAPEVVIMMARGGDHGGRAEEIFAMPALAQSPAATTGSFIAVDPASLGFGPRMGSLARALHDALYDTDDGH